MTAFNRILMCLGLVFVTVMSVTARSGAEQSGGAGFDARAAATYLDSRADAWSAWPTAQRDRGTFCLSCHTTLPYLLARPALHQALGEREPNASEAKIFNNLLTRAHNWKELEPFYPDQADTALRVLAVLALALPMRASAQSPSANGPAFDCAKATGDVEKMICADNTLGALDRKLDAVYKAALTKARDDMPRVLRAEQRGWVKGRDECWKAKDAANAVYLTISWTATSVRACVEGQYSLRIAELQVKYRLVPEQPPVFFACNNNPSNEVVAQFFGTDPPAARFVRGDRTVIGYLVKTGSGARYEGQNMSFWNKGKEATVTWLGEQLECTTK
ncbi:MAG: hypothetical protein RLZZ53_2894 [Acidobacteriota bacterium]|jgi:uncharacterized protein